MFRATVLFLFCVFISDEVGAKVRILTFQYNRPDFLEFQYETLKKFMLDDYELIALDDSSNPHKENAIREFCKEHDIQYVRFEQAWHESDPLNGWIQRWANKQSNTFFRFPLGEDEHPEWNAICNQPSIRHCHVIQYALDHFGHPHDDIVVIMDMDLFPIQPISIRELLLDHAIVAVDSEFQIWHYPWVPFIAFHPKRLPDLLDFNLHVDFIDGLLCDTGSHSYHYLNDHPAVAYRLYPRCHASDFYPYDAFTFLTFGFYNPKLAQVPWSNYLELEFYADYHFVHFLGGSSENHPSNKNQAIRDLIRCILDN